MSRELHPAGFTPCERSGEDPLLRCEGPNASCLGCPTGGFTLPRGLRGKSVLSGLDARLKFSPFILCKPPFHFMSGFICAENESVIPPEFRNYIILLFLKLSLRNPCTRTHTPRGVGVGTGAWGPRGRAGEENSLALCFPARTPSPGGARLRERGRVCGPPQFARSRPSERPRRRTAQTCAPSRLPGGGHGRRVTRPRKKREGPGDRAGGD